MKESGSLAVLIGPFYVLVPSPPNLTNTAHYERGEVWDGPVQDRGQHPSAHDPCSTFERSVSNGSLNEILAPLTTRLIRLAAYHDSSVVSHRYH